MKYLYQLRRIENVRAVSVGVLREFWGMNLGLLLFVKSILEMQKRGYKSIEYVWVLEDNKGSLGIVSKLGGSMYKRYRMYEYPLPENLSICSS
jgi:hypothetical protein